MTDSLRRGASRAGRDQTPTRRPPTSRFFAPGERRELDRLLAATGRGDVDAFGQLYDRTAVFVYSLACAWTHDVRDASRVTERVYGDVWAASRAEGQTSGALGLLLAAVRQAISACTADADPPPGTAGAG